MKIKRIITAVIAFSIVCGAVPMNGMKIPDNNIRDAAVQDESSDESENNTWGSNISWELDSEGTLTISGSGYMQNLYEQTDSSPWSENKNIKRIIVEDGIDNIGNYVFRDCVSLESVSLPDSIKTIGAGAFLGCENLKEINLPEKLETIREYAFFGCSSLVSADIPDGVTVIGDSTFASCSSLSSVTLPEGVYYIAMSAFSKCSSLESVEIPSSVKAIDDSAFYLCSKLSEITFRNPLCILYKSENFLPAETKILGYDNSTAQVYAEKFGNPFESIGQSSETAIVDYGTLGGGSENGVYGINVTWFLDAEGVLSIKGNNNEYIEASGVERYKKRPKWQAFASVAACMVLVGGIGGTLFALNKSNNNDGTPLASEVKTTTSASVTTTTAVTVPTTSKPANPTPDLSAEELTEIAEEGAKEFHYVSDILAGFNVDVDKNDKITKKTHFLHGNEGEPVDYYRVVDSRFETMDDFESYIGEYLADPLLTLRLSDNSFVETNGKLYVYQPQSRPATKVEFIGDPEVVTYDETTFCASVTIKTSASEDEMNAQIQLALVDGKWKVSGYQESFNTDAEKGSPNAELAGSILEDLRMLDSLRTGVGVNIEKDITRTIVDDNGYEYVYYKVSDDYANENFKNSIEDIKSWVDRMVTGEA